MDVLQLTWRFVLAVLATWRVTHLLAAEDGPGDVVVRLRALLGQSFAGRLMDCFYCLSIWLAAPAALFVTRHWLDWIIVWLAISGAACLLERPGQQPDGLQPGVQPAQGETHNVLWTETNGTQEEPAEHEPNTLFRADLAPDPNEDAYVFRAPTYSPPLGGHDNSVAYRSGTSDGISTRHGRD
jgi:hypothetical protein